MMKKPDLIFLSLTEAAKQLFGYEQVAKRIANIRLTKEIPDIIIVRAIKIER